MVTPPAVIIASQPEAEPVYVEAMVVGDPKMATAVVMA
jgi:hypothetical protein